MDRISLKSANDNFKNVFIVFEEALIPSSGEWYYEVYVKTNNWHTVIKMRIILDSDKAFEVARVLNITTINISDTTDLNFLVNLLSEIADLDWKNLSEKFVDYVNELNEDNDNDEVWDEDEDNDEEDLTPF